MRARLVVSLLLVACGFGRAGRAQPSRAFVLDTGARSLVALELPSGKRVGSLSLAGNPSLMLQSPDGGRLVVFDRGPGEDKDERGYKATGKSSALVVDAATLALVARAELGAGVAPRASYFSPDGRRLTALCPGYEPKNPAEAQARELVNLDLASGRETGRLTLEPGSVPVGISSDGRSLALVQGLPRTEKYPYPKARVFIVDLESLTVRSTLDATGWTTLRNDGSHLYLLEAGKPDKNPQKNRNGVLQVVSLETGALAASLDAGRAPEDLHPDEAGGQVLVPAEGPAGAAEGELRVIRGAALAATLKIAAKPRLLVRDRDSVYVVGEKAVTLVDPAALTAATVPLVRGAEALVDDDDVPTELQVSPDRKRAFVHYGLHHKVVTLDLEARKAIGATKTGRGGKKFLGNMMGGLYGWPGMLAVGYSIWIHTQPRMLAVRPDGRYAYAVNNQTKDITVVDGATGKSVEMIGGNGYALELLKDPRFLYEVDDSELRLIDLEANAKALEIPLPELRGLFFPPDRSQPIALAKQAVLLLDGASGKPLARLTDFQSPDVIVFSPTAPGPPPSEP